jgi:hypothetical protein
MAPGEALAGKLPVAPDEEMAILRPFTFGRPACPPPLVSLAAPGMAPISCKIVIPPLAVAQPERLYFPPHACYVLEAFRCVSGMSITNL